MQREKEIVNILLSILDFIYGYIYREREREREKEECQKKKQRTEYKECSVLKLMAI